MDTQTRAPIRQGSDRTAGGIPRVLTLLLGTVLVVRCTALPFPDIADTSEARFASSAQEMLRGGDWLTPYIYRGFDGWEPYWAKPPLHLWLTALSMQLFGEGEFAARFPSFIGAILIVLTLRWSLRDLVPPETINRSTVILVASAGFLVLSGLCVTDMLLTAFLTLALGCVVRLLFHPERSTTMQRLLLIGAAVTMALATLTKGFLGPLLFILTTALFLVLRSALRLPSPRMPSPRVIIGPLILCTLLTAPWFLRMEEAHPGFLQYFLIHEHLERYVNPDVVFRYSIGHREPFGAIWAYTLLLLFPWPLVLLMYRWKSLTLIDTYRARPSLIVFLLSWALTPLLFFSFTPNVLPTYGLPSLPPCALLLALILDRAEIHPRVLPPARTLTFALLLAAAGASLIGIVLIGTLATLLLGLGTMGFILLYPHLPTVEERVLTVWLAFLVGSVPLAAGGISPVRSMGTVVRTILELDQGPRQIGVLLKNPRSGLFYARSLGGNELAFYGQLTEEQLDSLQLTDLVVRQRDYPRLSRDLKEAYAVAIPIGTWLWLRTADRKTMDSST